MRSWKRMARYARNRGNVLSGETMEQKWAVCNSESRRGSRNDRAHLEARLKGRNGIVRRCFCNLLSRGVTRKVSWQGRGGGAGMKKGRGPPCCAGLLKGNWTGCLVMQTRCYRLISFALRTKWKFTGRQPFPGIWPIVPIRCFTIWASFDGRPFSYPPLAYTWTRFTAFHLK